MKVPILYQYPSLVQIRLPTFQMRLLSHSVYLTTWPQMTFDLGIWPLTAWTYEGSHKPSLVPTGLQLFKWGYFHIFSLSYSLTSDDLWPWYVTFDLINKWGFPCCIYDPSLVEIHQSMWKLEPNVNLFSQQTTTTTDNNNSGQSDPYVSFLLRQATQKYFQESLSGPFTNA